MGNPFCHVELNTTDVNKAKAFYTKLFDWELEDIPMPDGAYTTSLCAPSTADYADLLPQVEALLAGPPAAGGAGGMPGLAGAAVRDALAALAP